MERVTRRTILQRGGVAAFLVAGGGLLRAAEVGAASGSVLSPSEERTYLALMEAVASSSANAVTYPGQERAFARLGERYTSRSDLGTIPHALELVDGLPRNVAFADLSSDARVDILRRHRSDPSPTDTMRDVGGVLSLAVQWVVQLSRPVIDLRSPTIPVPV
jgi:hypothetical protein